MFITKTLYVSAKYLETPSIIAKNNVAKIIIKIPFLTLLTIDTITLLLGKIVDKKNENLGKYSY